MQPFEDDDRGYLTWIAQHPGGDVLNTANPPGPSYLILHRATRSTTTGLPTRGDNWTRAYLVFCAEHKAELKRPRGLGW